MSNWIYYLKDELGRDPKIAKAMLNMGSSRYYFKIILNKSYQPNSTRFDMEKALEAIERKFKDFEEPGITYIPSYKHVFDNPKSKDLINNHFIPCQDKWQIRNGGQYFID